MALYKTLPTEYGPTHLREQFQTLTEQEWEKKVPENESVAKPGIPGHLPLAPKVHIVSMEQLPKLLLATPPCETPPLIMENEDTRLISLPTHL